MEIWCMLCIDSTETGQHSTKHINRIPLSLKLLRNNRHGAYSCLQKNSPQLFQNKTLGQLSQITKGATQTQIKEAKHLGYTGSQITCVHATGCLWIQAAAFTLTQTS